MTGPAASSDPGPAIGSLCTGYGGLDLATLAVFGGHLTWCADNDKAAATIIEARFPGIPNLGDITTIDWRYVEPVDILTAGFPCQDISEAGKRAGIQKGTRSGIWANVMAAVRLLRPRLLIVENVAALRWRGLDRVLADLAGAGYDAAWRCVRASDIGAPHHRERVFLLAWPGDPALPDPAGPRPPRRHGAGTETASRPRPQRQRRRLPPAHPQGDGRHQGLAEPARLQRRPDPPVRDRPSHPDQPIDWGSYEPAIHRWERLLGRPAPVPTEPGRNGNRRLAPRLSEWLMGLPDGWVTGIGISRTAQLRAIGNGVVPLQGAHALRNLAAETPISLPRRPGSLPWQPDDGPQSATAATPLPPSISAAAVAEWLHYRSQGQPSHGSAAYLHNRGGGRAAEGGRAAPPGGSPCSSSGATRHRHPASDGAGTGEK